MMKPTFSLLLSLLEPAINQYLGLADNYKSLMTPIAGKVIAIEISDLGQTIYFCPGEERLQILENYTEAVDARLKGSLASLGMMGLSATPMHALFKGQVSIEGDTLLAHKFQSLFSKLDLNLENRLAAFTGAEVASRLTALFSESRAWTQDTLHSFRINLEEFLQEETRDLPAKAEAELCFQKIDQLRSDTDRLEARLDRLQPQTNLTAPDTQPQDSTR